MKNEIEREKQRDKKKRQKRKMAYELATLNDTIFFLSVITSYCREYREGEQPKEKRKRSKNKKKKMKEATFLYHRIK